MAARKQRTLLEKKNIFKAYEKLSTDLTPKQKAEKLKTPFTTLHRILRKMDTSQDKVQMKESELVVETETAPTTQSIQLPANGLKKQEEKHMQQIQMSQWPKLLSFT